MRSVWPSCAGLSGRWSVLVAVLGHDVLELRPQRLDGGEFVPDLVTSQQVPRKGERNKDCDCDSDSGRERERERATHSSDGLERAIQLVDVGQDVLEALFTRQLLRRVDETE